MPSIEEAAARFVDDVRRIESEYYDEAKGITDDLETVKRECGELMEAARKRHREAAIELNANYTERIRDAARLRVEGAEHAEDIHAAAASVIGLIGGPNHDAIIFTSDVARGRIEAAAKRREDAERYDRETENTRGIIFF